MVPSPLQVGVSPSFLLGDAVNEEEWQHRKAAEVKQIEKLKMRSFKDDYSPRRGSVLSGMAFWRRPRAARAAPHAPRRRSIIEKIVDLASQSKEDDMEVGTIRFDVCKAEGLSLRLVRLDK